MKQQNKLKVLLQVLFVSICVILMGGFSTMDTQAKAKKTYTVQFDKNGGKGKMSSKKYTVGKSYKLSKNKFTKKNYVFVGWNTKKSGKGKSYADQAKVKNLSTKNGAKVKLYAQWKKGITVKFDANSGSVDQKSMLVVKGKKYGSYAELPKASKPGYEFKGWYTKKKGGSKVTAKTKVKNKKKHTLYAQYKVVKYNINYVLDGGVNASNPSTYTVESNAIKLGTPTKAGYAFDGWYTDSAYQNKIDTIAKGTTGNLNLYAKWSLAEYTITYELNGGSNSRYNPDTYTVNTSKSLRNPSKTGYTFKGWYTDSSYTKKITKIGDGQTGNLTLYAKWTITTYSIGYQLDGGTNDPANPSSYQVTTETITLQPATKLGYEFVKWTKNGFDGTKVTRISKGSTGNVTLYANFEPINYTITYELDGGENHLSNLKTYTIEDKVILRKPTRIGYRFLGFYSDSEYKNPITKFEKMYGDITVYAKWEKITVTRAEWIAALVDEMGISISENNLRKDIDNQPIYTFVDLDDESVDAETKMKIEAAAAYGYIPYERDEEGGANYFDPNGAATREFVATSAVMALDFFTENVEAMEFTDANDINEKYRNHVAIAVKQGIVTKFEDGSFKPNNMLIKDEADATKDEMKVALKRIDEILEGAKVDETYDRTIYVENVLRETNEDLEYEIELISSSVSANSLDARTWTSSDEIIVRTSSTSDIAEAQVDQVITLPANDTYISGLALKVKKIDVSGSVVTMTCSVPEFHEVVSEINVSGIGKVDGSRVVGAEGVEVVYNPKGSQNSSENLDNAGLGVDVDDSFEVEETISFNLKEIEVSDNTKISGSVEVGIPDISYRIDAGVGWETFYPVFYVDDLYFSMTEQVIMNAKVESEVHGGGLGDNGAVEIGRVPFPLGPTGLSVDIVFWFNYNIDGSASVTCTINNTNGVQLVDGSLRAISDTWGDLEVEAEGTLEVGPKLSLMLTMFSRFDLMDLTADAGLGINGSVIARTVQNELKCCDVTAYGYLKLSVGENSLVDDIIGGESWDLFNKDNSPLKKNWHFEDTIDTSFHEVKDCTYGRGKIRGTVIDAETNQKIPNATVLIYSSSGELMKMLYATTEGEYGAELFCGDYTFVISASGYKSYQDVYTVEKDQTTYLEASLLIDREYTEAQEGTASGKILDSVNGNEVSGATLKIRKGWNKRTGDEIRNDNNNVLTTDSRGNYKLTLPLGNYTLEIAKDGYVNGYINIIVKESDTPDQNGELTPKHIEGDGILRVVLTWGESPRDLDSHMLGPKKDSTDRFHVYFSNKNYYSDYSNSDPTVNLDRDDTNSYGPETVTVYELTEEGTYSYYIYDYTNRSDSSSSEMGNISRAKVKVYDKGTLVTTFSVPYGEVGNCWHVFDYDAKENVIKPVNTMTYVSSSGSVGRAGNAETLENKDIQTILDDMVEKKENE